MSRARITVAAVAVIGSLLLGACQVDDQPKGEARTPTSQAAKSHPADGPLTVYSGRNEDLIGPLVERYEKRTGVEVKVRYGESAELAATLLEEGENTPADVFFSQDAGALGALEKEDRLATLPGPLLNEVKPRFRSRQGRWVGTSARARIVAYDRRELEESELPKSILDFTRPEWKDRIGWAPTNASLQAFVTALRVTEGEDAARRWVEGIVAGGAESYENNVAVRDAVAAGEIDVGFINHYYVAQAYAEEGRDYPVGIFQPPGGDPGSLVNVAGAGQLEGAGNPGGAQRFVAFLLSREGQRFFARETKEYPVAAGVKADPSLVPLERIEQPKIDLSNLDDLAGTVRLLEEAGAL